MQEEKQKLYYLKAVELFQDLSSEDMAWLDKVTNLVNFKKGEIVYSPDEPGEVLFLLKKGRVQLYRLSPEGKKLVIATLEAGTFLGEMTLVGQAMYGAFAEVVEDAVICVMTKEHLVKLLYNKPGVALRLLDTMGQRLLEAQASLDALAFKSVRARLASLLLSLAKQKGDNVIEGVSHQDLSERAATLRETTTQILDEFKAEGLVELGRMRITILNPAGLNKIAAV